MAAAQCSVVAAVTMDVLSGLCYVFVHKFLFNPHLDLEPDYVIRKPIIHRIQWCNLRWEKFSTFHTRVENSSVSWSVRHFSIQINGAEFSKNPTIKTMPETATSPWALRHMDFQFHLTNTWMPGPTPLTTPNDSSIAMRTFTQRRNKVPIGYNETPSIHPPNCPFPSTIAKI